MIRRRPHRPTTVHRVVPVDPATAARHRTARRRRTRATRAVLVLVLLAAVLLVPAAGADAITRPQTLFDLRPVSTAAVEVGFSIDHVGVRLDLPQGMDAHDLEGRVHVRLRHGTRWGAWQPLLEDGAQQPGRWTSGLLGADDADAYQVRGVPGGARAAAAAINTTDGPHEVVGWRRPGVAHAVTPCRSRADWGADESLRSDTRAHAPVQLLTVHHTATSTADAMADPGHVVRAIYSWHTQGNGWDDIGYQALVAPDGTLFEGRWSGSDSTSCLTAGGDGSDFGHDATGTQVVTGAHAGGHNTGNFGTAVLGTYTDVAPATAARTTLVAHLADLATRHALDPTGSVAYDNGVNRGTFPAIAGHRDINATECPGGALYDDLPQLRLDVAAAMAGDVGDGSGGAVTVNVHGEQPVAGTVTGTYLDTVGADGVAQVLTEVESGGPRRKRHALLEHVWTAELAPDHTWTLTIDGSATAAGDGDDFAVDVSTDGATWVPVLTVPAGTTGAVTGDLPVGIGGTIRIRVVDTVRAPGAAALDSLTVDRLVLTGVPGATAPDDGSTTLELTATGRKVKGVNVVDLAWTGATAVTVERDGTVVAEVSGSSWTDELGTKGGASHVYRVCSAGACSAHAVVDL